MHAGIEVTSAVTIVFTPATTSVKSIRFLLVPFHTQVSKTAPDKAASERNKLGACLKILPVTGSLQQRNAIQWPPRKRHEKVTTDLGQKLERVILQDINTLVIGAEVVYLLPDIEENN